MPETLLPKISSAARQPVDDLQIIIHVICIVVLVLMTAAMGYLVFKYRKREGNEIATSDVTHSTALEWIWTIIPTIFFFAFFYFGYDLYASNYVVDPTKSYEEVDVHAVRWSWTFKYPGTPISTDNHLYLEAGKEYKLNLKSIKSEVLHSFYLVGAGVKKDIIPGNTSYVVFDTSLTTFDANELAIGEKTTEIYCTEYCGDQHSAMVATVHILVPERYQAWKKGELKRISDQLNLSPAERGQQLIGKCTACHKFEKGGKKMVGPPLWGIFGKVRQIEGGPDVKADAAYLSESIMNPGAKIVKGYPNGMAQLGLTKQQVDDLVAYLKSLK